MVEALFEHYIFKKNQDSYDMETFKLQKMFSVTMWIWQVLNWRLSTIWTVILVKVVARKWVPVMCPPTVVSSAILGT